MTIYYKGLLVLSKNLKIKNISYSSDYFDMKDGAENGTKIRINPNYELSNKESKTILDNILKYCETRKDDTNEVREIFDISRKIVINTTKCKKIKMKIMFEKIADKDGILYGKEKLTGFIFPLLSKNDIKVLNIHYSFQQLYYDDDVVKLIGDIDSKLTLRDNAELCDCYLFEDGVANKNEINEYDRIKNSNKWTKFYNKLLNLYNMNIFSQDIFNQDNNVSNNSNDVFSITTTPNLEPNFSISSSSDNNLQSENNFINKDNSNISFALPANIKLDLLEKFKIIINSLTEYDIDVLKDMTNNDLNDKNLIKYILMTKEERLEFLNAINKPNEDNKTKVSLKKFK